MFIFKFCAIIFIFYVELSSLDFYTHLALFSSKLTKDYNGLQAYLKLVGM
tara:strand:+ start:1357 stop:1506 length:150 start_codon:yes stop_codon:yes gene_type:complete